MRRRQADCAGRLAGEGLTELATQYGVAITPRRAFPKAEPFADYMMIRAPEAVRGFEGPSEPVGPDHLP